jgi:DNA-binding NarL/FixJ family response regulator
MDIALVSPRRIIRKGLCTLLAQKGSIRVVADVDNALESFDLFRKTKPEILLIDCTHPANDLETLSRLRILLPETKLMLLIETSNEDFECHAIKAGARGCVPKEADPQALERALQVVAKGEIWVSQHLATRMIERSMHGTEEDGPGFNGLTDREWQILAFVAQGQRNKEIADHLCVSENTVKTHLAAVYKKLRVTTRLEAALHFFHNTKRNGQSSPKALKDLKQASRPRLKAKSS